MGTTKRHNEPDHHNIDRRSRIGALTREALALLTSGTMALTAMGCVAEDDDSDPVETSDSAQMGSSGGEDTGEDTEAVVDDAEYVVLIQGDLFTDDMGEARSAHDPLAAGGEEAAKMLGDFGHDAMLGTELLGTTPDAFLGLDRWDNAEGLQTFYGNPEFAEAFGTLFSAPPALGTFVHRSQWHEWGDLESGDSAQTHFFVVVRGRLAESDPAAAQVAHDAVAQGAAAQAQAAGDQAHVVFTGLEDPQEFLAIDIWHDSANMEAVYTSPDFAAAFGSLFETPPTLSVYRSTDWHQW